jgi:lipopolysaccharide export system protein LptA
MYNKKSLSILIGFTGLTLVVLISAFTSERKNLNSLKRNSVASVERSYFKNVHYFKSEELKPTLELKSTELEILNNRHLDFKKPTGLLVSASRDIRYKANHGKLDQETKLLNLIGDVHLYDKTSDYMSSELTYNGSTGIIYANGGVSTQIVDEKTLDIIKVKSESMTSYMKLKKLNLVGDVQGRIIRKRRYEGDMKFRSETAVLNSLESRLELNKSVKLHRNNYYLTAGSAEIFLENFNKKLKYYALYDDVKLEEKLKLKSGKNQTRRAFAEKLEGHQRTGKIILTGAPRVEQGNDIIKGYQITLRENVELVEVDDSQSSFSLKKDKK